MNKEHCSAIFLKCQGRGKQNKGTRKKVKLRYLKELKNPTGKVWRLFALRVTLIAAQTVKARAWFARL